MQPREEFVSSRDTRLRHTCLGTLLGTVGGFFAASVQETEGKRAKATVFLTVAFGKNVASLSSLAEPRHVAARNHPDVACWAPVPMAKACYRARGASGRKCSSTQTSGAVSDRLVNAILCPFGQSVMSYPVVPLITRGWPLAIGRNHN